MTTIQLPQTENLQLDLVMKIKERILSKLNLYEIAILVALVQPDTDHTELLQTLRSQQKDDPRVMAKAIGEECGKMLEMIIP